MASDAEHANACLATLYAGPVSTEDAQLRSGQLNGTCHAYQPIARTTCAVEDAGIRCILAGLARIRWYP
jgi:hypothetical protein